MSRLTPEEFDFLEWLRDYPGGEVHQRKMNFGQHDRMRSALKKGYAVAFTVVPPGMESEMFGDDGLTGYRISADGRDALTLEQQARDQEAAEKADKHLEQKREDKRDRKDSFRLVLEILGLLVSFITGILAQDHFDVLGWVQSLFH